jgi:hypothetical protein
MIRALALVAACAVAGCLDDPGPIPCVGDDTCPTGYWCNGASGSCARYDQQTPPLLELDGVKAATTDPFGDSVTVPSSGGVHRFLIQVGNYGQAEAAYPTIVIDGPACLSGNGELASNLIGILASGDHTVQSVYVDPMGCPASVDVAVHLSLKGESSSNFYVRQFPDGHFTVNLSP